MLEVYYKYRCKYQDYIIFIKSGSFYEVFDKDSMILNSIFYYKVKRFKDTIKTGFPINKLEHIIKLMGNINYIVIDNDNIIDEKVFSDNKYDSYTFDTNTDTASDTCTHGNTSGCQYGWLYDKTNQSCTGFGCLNNSYVYTVGYWTISPDASDSSKAWHVYYVDILYYDYVGYDTTSGVRTVITVSKSQLG